MKKYLIALFLLSSIQVIYGQNSTVSGEYVSLHIGIENRGKPSLSNKTGNFHPDLFPSLSSSIGFTRQKHIKDKWYYSVGVNSSVHFDGIIYKRGLTATQSTSNTISFNATVLELNGIRLNVPLHVLYQVMGKPKTNIYLKAGVQLGYALFRQSIGTAVSYGFLLEGEEYRFDLDHEGIPYRFEYAPTLGFKIERNRFVYDFDVMYNDKYQIGGEYSAVHQITEAVIHTGYAKYKTTPWSMAFSVGYKLKRY